MSPNISKNIWYFSCLIPVLVMFFMSRPAFAQLQIAPVALYLDDSNRTGRIVVRNSSSDPVEIEVELLFGYPSTDENGNLFLKLFNSVPDDEPSAKEWIRAYPRRLVLNGGERQTIRFAARPPAGLPDGEYWVRPAVVAQVPDVQVASYENQNISTRLNLRKRTILSINYRNGNVQTGIGIGNISANYRDGILQLNAELERKGNAAFLGHYEIRLLDSRDNPITSDTKEIAVYRNQNRNLEINIHNLSSGTYKVELELTTRNRNDDGILQASSATGTTSFTIP